MTEITIGADFVAGGIFCSVFTLLLTGLMRGTPAAAEREDIDVYANELEALAMKLHAQSCAAARRANERTKIWACLTLEQRVSWREGALKLLEEHPARMYTLILNDPPLADET